MHTLIGVAFQLHVMDSSGLQGQLHPPGPYSLSTPCNGFIHNVMLSSPPHHLMPFQLHVMDSRPAFTASLTAVRLPLFQLHVMDSGSRHITWGYNSCSCLSTPCNGFRRFEEVAGEGGLWCLLSTPCNGFGRSPSRSIQPIEVIVCFQLHVMDSLKSYQLRVAG